MEAPRWLAELRAELARRKLPPLYVERFVLELQDHYSDLMEDRMSTDAKDLHGVLERLGSPGQVAASAAREYRKARFAQRHPVLMFVVLPILSLPLLWFVSVVSIILMAKLLGIESGKAMADSAAWQVAHASVPYVVVALMVVPVAVAAAFFCRLAARAGVTWKWSLAACCLIAVLGSAAMTQLVLPTEHSKGAFSFGFRMALRPTASQVLQFLVPMSICGWAIWQQVKARPAPAELT